MTLTDKIFTGLYNKHENALYKFALKLTHDVSSAQDLVQETALKAFKSFHTFREGSNFKSWTFTILKNTFISKYHKIKSRSQINTPIEEFTFSVESSFAVDNTAYSEIRLDDIESCIEQLSYKCRLPFMMHTQGFKYNEIADQLNIPIGTVKSRINYARNSLQ